MSSLTVPYPPPVETFRLQTVGETFKQAVGRRIRSARVDAGLSQNELAHRLPGAPAASQISRWERGEALPNPAHLQQLARVLETTVGAFFDD